MHTSFDLMLSLLLVWGALMPEAVLANDAAEWCEYVQSTPEPALLFYNRIPKSGSTTMEAVIRRQRKELMEFDYFPAPSKFWDQDFSTGTWPAKLYEYVNGQKQGSSRPMTVIDGHIQYFDFNMMKITKRANNRVEFMQLFRTCVDRAVSHYYFKIYDCIDANKAKHEQRYEKYKQGLFGTVDISACKQNDTCLQNSGVFQRVSTGMIAGYFSGASCAKPCSQVKKIGAARRNVAATSGRYVTFGPLELLSEYLEMLECVYPTYFSGAPARFKERPIHNKKSHKDSYEAHVKRLFSGKCENSTDQELYPFLTSVFTERYTYMKQSKGGCCRKKLLGA